MMNRYEYLKKNFILCLICYYYQCSGLSLMNKKKHLGSNLKRTRNFRGLFYLGAENRATSCLTQQG